MIGPRHRIAISALALLLACAQASEPEAEPETDSVSVSAGDPAEAVRAYFDAIARHDCAALEHAVAETAARALAEHGCEQTIAEFEQHGARLDGIESVRVDGRDAGLRLVRTKMHESGRSKLVVIGVRNVEGRWRVVRI